MRNKNINKRRKLNQHTIRGLRSKSPFSQKQKKAALPSGFLYSNGLKIIYLLPFFFSILLMHQYLQELIFLRCLKKKIRF